mgnify:CR=1 FL=1
MENDVNIQFIQSYEIMLLEGIEMYYSEMSAYDTVRNNATVIVTIIAARFL